MRKYGKTEQFRHAVSHVKHSTLYRGNDENGDPIYADEEGVEFPTITAKGTVKLHGTNAAVGMTRNRELFTQSRKNRFDPRKDPSGHQGFNQYVLNNEMFYKRLLSQYFNGPPGSSTVVEEVIIFGEWAGEGIQSGVGITQTPKAFYPFAITGFYTDEEGETRKIVGDPQWKIKEEHSFFPLWDDTFPQYSIEIDFNNPSIAAEQMEKWVQLVEDECPVAKYHGIRGGVGEGIVFTYFFIDEHHRFKVKGLKHEKGGRSGKVKVEIAPEVKENIDAFVEATVTPQRVLQAVQETSAESKRDTGKVLKWINEDIIAEELDTLTASGLEWRQVAPSVSTRARELFFKELDDRVLG